MLRAISRGLVPVLLAVVSVSAADGPVIKFTDVKLKNGLRVIISEDHTRADRFRGRQLLRRVRRRESPPHRVRAPLRAHDVQGLRERRARRASRAHLHQRRLDERDDEPGPHALLRDRAGQPARARALPRRRPHEVARHQQGQPRQPARRGAGRAPPARRQPAVRPDVREDRRAGLRQPAYKHSVIGSMEDLNAASVDDVATFFKTYYAPNNAVLSIVGDLDPKKTMALVEKYFGAIARQPDPKRPDLTEPPHTAERRSTIDDPLARLPRLDIAWIAPPAQIARQRRDRRPVRRAVVGPQLAAQPGRRPREAAGHQRGDLRRRQQGPRADQRVRDGRARQEPGGRGSGALRGDREGEERPDRRLGDREGAQQRAAASRRRR